MHDYLSCNKKAKQTTFDAIIMDIQCVQKQAKFYSFLKRFKEVPIVAYVVANEDIEIINPENTFKLHDFENIYNFL
jgi:TATA-binding protein-associated factor Taf7